MSIVGVAEHTPSRVLPAGEYPHGYIVHCMLDGDVSPEGVNVQLKTTGELEEKLHKFRESCDDAGPSRSMSKRPRLLFVESAYSMSVTRKN
jgi:hypothetical protein